MIKKLLLISALIAPIISNAYTPDQNEYWEELRIQEQNRDRDNAIYELQRKQNDRDAQEWADKLFSYDPFKDSTSSIF